MIYGICFSSLPVTIGMFHKVFFFLACFTFLVRCVFTFKDGNQMSLQVEWGCVSCARFYWTSMRKISQKSNLIYMFSALLSNRLFIWNKKTVKINRKWKTLNFKLKKMATKTVGSYFNWSYNYPTNFKYHNFFLSIFF